MKKIKLELRKETYYGDSEVRATKEDITKDICGGDTRKRDILLEELEEIGYRVLNYMGFDEGRIEAVIVEGHNEYPKTKSFLSVLFKVSRESVLKHIPEGEATIKNTSYGIYVNWREGSRYRDMMYSRSQHELYREKSYSGKINDWVYFGIANIRVLKRSISKIEDLGIDLDII